MGLDGAAEAAGVLYLFRHGRYVAIDDATGNAGAPVALNTFANWPATANWSQGSFDAIGSNVDDPSYTKVHIWHNLEYIVVDMVAQAVVDGPHPLNYYVTDAMLNVMQNGFSAVTFSAVEFNVTAYQGMVIYQATEQNGGIAIQYPAFNGGIWTPNLVHAPSGVTGALWGVLQLSIDQPIPYGVPISHDGTGWQGVLASSQLFTHIAAGSDGAVFGVVMTGTRRLCACPTAGGWQHLEQPRRPARAAGASFCRRCQPRLAARHGQQSLSLCHRRLHPGGEH